VSDDLITGSSETTPWLVCDSDTPTSVARLDEGGCAYRETPADPGITYRMSCGVSVSKYSSITLAFLDAEHNTLDSAITEVFEHTSGAYSVTLEAPAATASAAIGIYGEPGSGFQDCVLVDATPPPEPTRGSIAGVTWLDANSDSILDPTEVLVPGTSVTLLRDGNILAQTQTDNNGAYNFGSLDVDLCYAVSFAAADATVELGFAGGDNDALAGGVTGDVCLTEAVPNVPDVDAGFVAIPPPVPPADFAMCGHAWADLDGNGMLMGSDTTLPFVTVKLFDADTDTQIAMTETSDPNGSYFFDRLAAGNYYVMFNTPDGYEPTSAVAAPEAGKSFISAEGNTSIISIPADGNTPDSSACTVASVNGGFVQLPVVLAPTVANNDRVSFDQGVDFTIDALANDLACDNSIVEVALLGHNVPGLVTFNAATQMFDVSNTTGTGTFTIEYSIRGACGSGDTATITVVLNEVIPPAPPAAPDAPICRVETRGQEFNGGVDVFNADCDNGFAENYNLFDRDRNLVITVDSTDFTHKNLIDQSANQNEAPYIGLCEIEWNGSAFGFDQVSIHYVSAVENGVESQATQCVRSNISPIALDLQNQGRIHMVAGDYSVDVDGDGIIDPISHWFAPSAGILVTADAHGQITGDQMFGNVPGIYSDGYAELATLDTNADKKLTGDELQGLEIWHDLNSNTIVDDGEISSLNDHLIVSLSLDHYKFMSRAGLSNGKSVLVEDVWLPLIPLATR